jgi:hypothetical protein|tara:strand:+ start:1164 stop:1538 length:375 start_codon:yes stop_codon:yes gene_type:complete
MNFEALLLLLMLLHEASLKAFGSNDFPNFGWEKNVVFKDVLSNLIESFLNVVDPLMKAVLEELIDACKVEHGQSAASQAFGLVGICSLWGARDFEEGGINTTEAEANGAWEVRREKEEGDNISE